MKSLIKNIISAIINYAYYRYAWVKFAASGVKLDWKAKINPNAKINGVVALGKIEIGRNVEIGKGSYASSGIIYTAKIGSYCSIGPNVIIAPTEHNLDHWTTSPYEALSKDGSLENAILLSKPSIIGNGVWIGANVIIMQGVEIGEHSVIAAGSIVTKSVPENEVWAGVPARRLRALKKT